MLDGAVDPTSSAFSMNMVQARGFEVALRVHRRLPAAAALPAGPRTVTAGIARLQGLLNRAASNPLTSSGGQPGDSAMLLGGVSSRCTASYWPDLRPGWPRRSPATGRCWCELADCWCERNRTAQYTNLIDANMAVNCLDRPGRGRWRRGVRGGRRRKVAPLFGPSIMWGSLPCAYWPVPAAAPVPLRAPGAPPILVVGTTRDPATPYRWARPSRAAASGVLLGWNGDGTPPTWPAAPAWTGRGPVPDQPGTPAHGTICP